MSTNYALIKVSDVKPGVKLRAHDGFTCIKNEEILEVKEHDGELYVDCSYGKHFLEGQLDKDGKLYVGFWIVQ